MSEVVTPTMLKAAAYLEASNFALPADWEIGRPKTRGMTIDSIHTRDKDDAIYLQASSDGGLELKTSIADVGTFLPPYRDIVAYGRYMGETRYNHGGNIPMTPPLISEGMLSILDDKLYDGQLQPTPVLSASLHMDTDGQVGGLAFSRDSLTPTSRSYGKIASMAAGKNSLSDYADVQKYVKVAHTLLEQRQNRGAFAVYDVERGIMSDDDGNIVSFPKGSNRAGQLIVQEFMILTNAAVANYMARNNIPALYRNHHFRANASPKLIHEMLTSKQISIDALRNVFGRARYSPYLEGHVGLSLDAYLHFTSPLRRFADYANHVNLVAHLEGREIPYQNDELAEIAVHLNAVQDETRSNRREAAANSIASRVPTYARPIIANRVRPEIAATPLPEIQPALTTQPEQTIDFHEMAAAATAEELDDLRRQIADGQMTAGQLGDLLPLLATRNPNWKSVGDEYMQLLARSPEHAPSIFSVALHKNGLKSFTYSEKPLGGQTFRADAIAVTTSGEVFTASSEAIGVRPARHLAAVHLVGAICDLPLAESLQKSQDLPTINNKGVLKERLEKIGLFQPVYVTDRHVGSFVSSITVSVNGIEKTFTGTASTVKAAEQAVALAALSGVEFPAPAPKVVPPKIVAKTKSPSELASTARTKKYISPINILQEHVLGQYNFNTAFVPTYSYENPIGPANALVFTCSVTFDLPDGTTHSFTATGSSKMDAKKAAAKVGIQHFMSQE